ncbi:hypothetical protein LC593_27385 [Nostoc sp. CHAB 5844]|nr:hypothetical protein [Nostoc sp. CHAB 5844]
MWSNPESLPQQYKKQDAHPTKASKLSRIYTTPKIGLYYQGAFDSKISPTSLHQYPNAESYLRGYLNKK